MRIQHNIPAMASYRNYSNNVAAVNKNLEKLSSGYKINRAGDDAAGLAISEKMRAQISGLEQAQNNAKSGINLVQTAEGALTEVHDMLNRMFTLAEQSANGTYDNDVDRVQLQKEVQQLRDEIDRIADSSNFNGIKLLDGSLDSSVKTADTEDVAVTVVSDGQLGKTPQAGKYSMDFSNVTISSSKAAQTVSLEVFEQTLTVQLGEGEKLSGGDLAQKFAEKWTTQKSNTWKNDSGFTLNASVEGDKLVFTMDKAPSAPWDLTMGSGKFEYSDTDYITGTNAEEITVTQEREAVDTTMGRMYGQASFTLGTDVDLADGTALTIGDETYVFAIGADSKYKNANNVIDLTDQKAGGTDLAKTAAARLSEAAKNNKMFKVGSTLTDGKITITEKEGAVDYTKNNLAGDDNKGSFGNGGTTNAKATDWAGLVKTGTVDKKAMGTALTLQIGDTAEDFNKLTVSVKDMHAAAMGIGDIDIGSQSGASEAMSKIKDAINYVSDVRGTLGATQNRLDHTINNLSVMQENIQDAESTIRDVDVAKEMMEYTKNNILVQSAQAMLAQANQLPQGVLQLLG